MPDVSSMMGEYRELVVRALSGPVTWGPVESGPGGIFACAGWAEDISIVLVGVGDEHDGSISSGNFVAHLTPEDLRKFWGLAPWPTDPQAIVTKG